MSFWSSEFRGDINTGEGSLGQARFDIIVGNITLTPPANFDKLYNRYFLTNNTGSQVDVILPAINTTGTIQEFIAEVGWYCSIKNNGLNSLSIKTPVTGLTVCELLSDKSIIITAENNNGQSINDWIVSGNQSNLSSQPNITGPTTVTLSEGASVGINDSLGAVTLTFPSSAKDGAEILVKSITTTGVTNGITINTGGTPIENPNNVAQSFPPGIVANFIGGIAKESYVWIYAERQNQWRIKSKMYPFSGGGGGGSTLQNTYDLSNPANIILDNAGNGPFQILNEVGDPNNMLFRVASNNGINDILGLRRDSIAMLTSGALTFINSTGAIIGPNSVAANCGLSYIFGGTSSAASSNLPKILGNNNTISNSDLGVAIGNNSTLGNTNNSIVIGNNISCTAGSNLFTVCPNPLGGFVNLNIDQMHSFHRTRGGFTLFDATETRHSSPTNGNVTWYTQSNFISDVQTGVTVSIDTLPFRSAGINNNFLLISDSIIIRTDINDSLNTEHVRTEGIVSWRDDLASLTVVSNVNTVVQNGSYAQAPTYFIFGDNIELRFPPNVPPTGFTYEVASVTKMIVSNANRI